MFLKGKKYKNHDSFRTKANIGLKISASVENYWNGENLRHDILSTQSRLISDIILAASDFFARKNEPKLT